MTTEQEQAFTEGYRMGVEHAVTAHDDLVMDAAVVFGAHPDYQYDERAKAALEKVAALRTDEGEAAALNLYRLERAS
jgi:hypothetical protein